MKKKVFRERYGLTEDKKAGTIEIPKIDTKITAEKAIELIDKGIELLKEEKKPTKRGKKNVKSNK